MTQSEKKLGKLISIITGFPFVSSKFIEKNNVNPIIRIRDLNESKITLFTEEKYEDKYRVKKGDILIGMDGDFIVTRWNNREVGLNQRIMKVDDLDINNLFLYYVLHSKVQHINKITPSTTVQHLSSKDINSIKINVPVNLEQQKIADFLYEFDNAIEYAKEELEVWKNIKKGLLQQMFDSIEISM